MKINQELENQVIDLYLNKKVSGEEISRRLGISPSTVLRKLRKNNINVISCRHAVEINLDEIVKNYKSGIPIHVIAKSLKSSEETISKKLKEQGVKINHSGIAKFDENIFDIIDTEEKAYWLGFIFADGCISNIENCKKTCFSTSIALKGSDYDHLVKFNTFMKCKKTNVKKRLSNAGNGKLYETCVWTIGNRHLWEQLNSLGCKPNKSLILEFPKLSIFTGRSLIKHFIRGYFDGDGGLSFTDKTHRYPSICIAGSESFLETLKNHIPINVINKKLYSYKKIKTLNFTHQKAMAFLHYIYKDSTIYLDRKFKKYEEFCRSYK